MQRVLILGATGGMGRRVAHLLRSECPSVALRLGARRTEAVKRAFRSSTGAKDSSHQEVVCVHREDGGSLQAALTGVRVVINAIGPYDYAPSSLLDACEAAGVQCVDLASEPDYLAAVSDWGCRSERSIATCPGASTIPGLVELTAARLAARVLGTPDRLEVYLSLGSAHRLTRGLLTSLTLPLGLPLPSNDGNRAFRTLRRHPMPELGKRWFGHYPSPFDAQGVPMGERTVAGRLWVGLDRPWLVLMLRAASYFRPHISDVSWKRLMRAVHPVAGLASYCGTQPGGLRIEVMDAVGRLLGSVSYLAHREGMNVPALPAVWAARALLKETRPGVRSLTELIGFDEAAASLRSHGFVILEEGP